MKFYETHYEEYIQSVEQINIHPELSNLFLTLPKNIYHLENMIIHGPSGVGKYSQVLNILKKYSHSLLKYDKKISVQTDKQTYNYRISDIHYEIDMSLLGCNSKVLWHEAFCQIVDIISVKSEKVGVILCKNFHMIHTELLDIFYSYMQQYNHIHSNIKIVFFILTEHVSFIPNNILNCSEKISIGRPIKDNYVKMACSKEPVVQRTSPVYAKNRIENVFVEPICELNLQQQFIQRISNYKGTLLQNNSKMKETMENIEPEHIINGKEIRSFSLLGENTEVPKDIFNIICNNIISAINDKDALVFTTFRDTLYDILIYNLDAVECLWYILSHFIRSGHIKSADVTSILDKTYVFLRYYNNNYRPIYHLESMFFYIIIKIYGYDEL